ncbi:hypothetical protein D3C86_1979140 [compost metagenome]
MTAAASGTRQAARATAGAISRMMIQPMSRVGSRPVSPSFDRRMGKPMTVRMPSNEANCSQA